MTTYGTFRIEVSDVRHAPGTDSMIYIEFAARSTSASSASWGVKPFIIHEFKSLTKIQCQLCD